MRSANRRCAVLALVTVGALLAVTTACTSDSPDPAGQVTIRFDWWGDPGRAEVTEKAVALFEKKNSSIRVDTSYAEFDAYFTKLDTQIAGGGAPDVIQMDSRHLREYADRNQLAPLDNGPSRVDGSGITHQLLTGGMVNGTLYGIPPTQHTQVFRYDFAQWEKSGAAMPKEGWKWSDLLASAQKVSDSTHGKVRGLGDFGGIEDWFEVWLRQQGKSLYTQEGKLGYTAVDVEKWWQLADTWRRSGASTPADDPVTRNLASSGFGYDSDFTAKSWEIAGRELKLAPLPTDTGKLGQYAKPAMMFGISQSSKQKEAAAKLINLLLNDLEAGELLGMSRGLPANAGVQARVGATLTGPPLVALHYLHAVGAKLEPAPPPPPKGAGTIKSAFQRLYDDVIFARMPISQAATKFIAEAQQAMAA